MCILSFITLFLITLMPPYMECVVFDFHLIDTLRNATENELECQNLGYQGFAVVSTPEMYNYALTLTQEIRDVGKKGVYIGLRYQRTIKLITWADGSLPATDSPWRQTVSDQGWGYIHRFGGLQMASAPSLLFALCGNHSNLPTEVYGKSVPGKHPTSVNSSLATSPALSYPECCVMCGLDHSCRLAVFNSGLLTCTVLGPGLYTGFTADPQSEIFIRNAFL